MEKSRALENAHHQLNKFIGNWHTEGIILSSNNEPEIKITGTDTYEWIVDGFFLLHKADVAMGNERSKTYEIIGYDDIKQHYTMQHYDNTGSSGLMTARVNDGIWIFSGDTLRFTGGFNQQENIFAGIWEQMTESNTWAHFMNIELIKRD